MNKVIAIHLQGSAFQLEEEGYELLRGYLERATRQLGTNPDKAEILADIERAIAEKFRALLSATRNVVLTPEAKSVVDEMGPVADATGTSDPAGSAKPDENANADASAKIPFTPRRLFLIQEGAMLGGVCSGFAAYLGIDVTLIRLAVLVLTVFSFGTVALLYFLAQLVIPVARTPEEKAAASGPSPTAQEFIRRAREGYYEGLKNIHDKHARREWKRKFREEMREMKRTMRWEVRWDRDWVPSSTCPPPPPSVGAHLLGSLLAVCKGLLAILTVCAVVSLLTTGTVFGVHFPGRVPLWAGVIILVLLYKVFAAPLKALRRAIYFRTAFPASWWWHPLAELWHGVIVLVVLVAGLWLANRFVPGFHDVIANIPTFLANVAGAMRDWWNSR